ncbi:Uncharacterised protein [Paucimonas lemoignei]|nr:Uncharacterised protein [Paucimonas lemoignei]
MPAQPKVRKGSCPTTRSLAGARHARNPTLIRRVAAKGHPWPSAAKPASCRFPLRINIELRPAWFDGALKIKIKRARGGLIADLLYCVSLPRYLHRPHIAFSNELVLSPLGCVL